MASDHGAASSGSGTFSLEAYTDTLETVAYVPVVLLMLWVARYPRQMILLGLLATLFLTIGYTQLSHDELSLAALINRLIAGAVIWTAIVFAIKYRKSVAAEERQRLQLEAVFNNATEAIFIIDQNGTIVLANPWALKMFGFSRKELEGQNTLMLVPGHLKKNHAMLRQAFLHNATTEIQMPKGSGNEFLCQKKDGTVFPVDVSIGYSNIENESLFVAFVLDITEHRRSVKEIRQLNKDLEKRVAERTRELREALSLVEKTNVNLFNEIQERNRIETQLYSSQTRYNGMAHYFPRGWIGVLDKDLRYLLIDGEDLKALKWNQAEMIGAGMTDFLDPLIRTEVEQALNTALHGQHINFEIPQEEKLYRVFAVPLPDSDQKINEILVVGRDITERVQYENGLRNSLAREKELNELKSRFVSMASHEFRTPLTNIVSSAFLLENYHGADLEKNKDTHLSRIKRSAKILTEILNDFLSLGRLDEGKVQPNLVDTDIPEFIRDLLKEFESLKQPNQRIAFRHNGENQIRTDKGMLRNIVTNLVSNALKYTHPTDRIDVQTEIDDKHLLIAVTDHGMGIAEEDKNQIFDRFYRAKEVANIQGTGLGLSIVLRFANLLGGTVTFESVLKEGSTFTVTLPVHLEETIKS